MLEQHLELTKQFNLKVTGLPMPEVPTLLVDSRREYARTVILEELNEFLDATTVGDQADALVDLVYFTYGRLLEMGVHPGPAFKLVHAANMAKKRGANKRGNVFEAAKPEGWSPPDWEAFLGPKPRKKVILLGHGRHGKDTVAEILRDNYGHRFTSSSFFCAERVMMPAFEAGAKGGASLPTYATVDECFQDRHNWRAFWFQTIAAWNQPDGARLSRAIFEHNDLYVGLRSKDEFAAAKLAKTFDVCLWVDASKRLPPEGQDSCTVEAWMADHILDNNGDLEQLKLNVAQLAEFIL